MNSPEINQSLVGSSELNYFPADWKQIQLGASGFLEPACGKQHVIRSTKGARGRESDLKNFTPGLS